MATSRGLEVRGARDVALGLALDARAVDSMCRDLTVANARDLVRKIQHNASTGFHGPNEGHIAGTGPGPNVVTGDYVSSWTWTPAGVGAIVSTDAPQADRLEYGFVGADSRGRLFHQKAYPHIGPAVDEVEGRLARQVDEGLAAILRGGTTVRFSG